MAEILTGTAEYNVAVDETDCLGRLKPGAWLQYMQDLATAHAESIGVGFHAMYGRGLLWVLTKISLRVFHSPKIGDFVRAVTYPKQPGRVECVRDFYFYNADGAEIARGSTVWCVIDVETRRIRRAAEFFPYPEEAFFNRNALETAVRAIEIPDGARQAYQGRVMIADTDRNLHLNNARYGDMLLNACPQDFILSQEIAGFDLSFARELRLGDEYSVGFAKAQEEYYVEAADGAGRLFAARCYTRAWTGGIL